MVATKELSGKSSPRPRLRFAVVLATALIASPLLSSCSASGSGGTTLHILMWANSPANAATKAIDTAFEKANPGVTVQLSVASSQTSAWNTLVTSSLAAKNVDVLAQFATIPALAPPPATHIPASGTLALQQSGQLVNLANQPFMKNYGLAFQKFANGINDKIYGLDVSEYSENGNLIVKTAILQKYHLSLPTTYNQLLAECATLKSHGITPFFISAQGAQSFLYNGILQQMMMAGKPGSQSETQLLKLAQDFYSGKLNWNSPIFVNAAKEWATLMNYSQRGSTAIGQNSSYADWAAVPNDYPFLGVGTYGIPAVLQANPKLQLTDFALPATNVPADNVMSVKPDLTWTIPASSANIPLAEKWLAFFSEPANYAKWLTATGGFSLQPKLSNSAPYLAWDNAHLANAAFGPNVLGPWLPAGAPPAAGGPTSYLSPTLVDMAPLGRGSVMNELNIAARDYTNVLNSIKKQA